MMKKIMILMCIAVLLCGCENTEKEKISEKSFCGSDGFGVVKDSQNGNCTVIYDRKTKVMYLVLNNTHYTSSVTPLYNADGSLRIYDGE